jgi:hypothetical protein
MSLDKEKVNRYKAAGYTHYISWEEFHKGLGMNVKKGFATTADAVQLHLKHLQRKKDTLNLKVEVL